MATQKSRFDCRNWFSVPLFLNSVFFIFLQTNFQKIDNCKVKTPMANQQIVLKNNGEAISLGSTFSHSTNGQAVDFLTHVTLASNDQHLTVSFECMQDDFVDQNNMTQHNDPLYNQEVFEVFISTGKEDSKHYLELEINPNNALWIGTINNPTLGEEAQSLEGMVAYENTGIVHEAIKSKKSWHGKMQIPWVLIGKDPKGEYRINFYRIRANHSHTDPNWVCDTQTCDFACWNSTLSGESPAFHKPKRFGYLRVE